MKVKTEGEREKNETIEMSSDGKGKCHDLFIFNVLHMEHARVLALQHEITNMNS